MSLKLLVITILYAVTSALAQTHAWCDPDTPRCFQAIESSDLTIAAAFSNSTTATDFVGEIISPVSNKWVGVSLGSRMTNNLVVVVGPSSPTAFVASARMSSGFQPSMVYPIAKITQLSGSRTNATHWKYVFRCERCLSWTDFTGTPHTVHPKSQVQAVTWGTTAQPSNPNFGFSIPDTKLLFALDVASARTANYSSYF
ncbi:iron reductase domain protein [Serendipita vermifera MAFF 305830]|uniref:Iron reductase domain protein n=1 Tax=Serendipita vermifera MAFF 305830 TaxID=933852 RepID=A0A0C3B3H9_SERVB|nr:iron reductase domain protein [Serendipita vermifera MAFF 305830]